MCVRFLFFYYFFFVSFRVEEFNSAILHRSYVSHHFAMLPLSCSLYERKTTQGLLVACCNLYRHLTNISMKGLPISKQKDLLFLRTCVNACVVNYACTQTVLDQRDVHPHNHTPIQHPNNTPTRAHTNI